MKVSRKSLITRSFKPFELIIRVESVAEARGLYAIFNRIPNTKVLAPEASEDITDVLGREFYVDGGLIANGIKYEDYYPGR